MTRGVTSIESRERALAAVLPSLRHGAQGGRVVLVRGRAGMGKTRLLEEAVKRWRADGVRAVQVRLGSQADELDATLDALRREFDRSGGSELIDGISAVARSRAGGGDARRVASGLSRVFGRIGRLGPTAVLFDDVLAAADPARLLVTACRPGCLVVAAVRDDVVPTPAAAELVSLADAVVDLQPLSDSEIAAVVGADLDERAHQALRVSLGPLYGNPGTVLDTVAELRGQGRLVPVDGRVRLKDSDAITLPENHEILRRTRLHTIPLAAAAAFGGLDVDELPMIADALGEDVARCGRAVDRAVEAGALMEDERGRLVCLCPALAASITRAESATVERLRSLSSTPPVEVAAPVALREHRRSPAATAQRAELSTVECKIIDLIGLGFTNRRIASEIRLSEKTVERYLTRLYARTGCRSRVELVAAGLSGRGGALSVDQCGPAA